jgi:lysozyme
MEKYTVKQIARAMLMFEEGLRLKPYYCKLGYPTVGWGFKIGDKGDKLPKFTLPRVAADAWLDSILDTFPEYPDLTNNRAAVLWSMQYQLGMSGLKGFTNMWENIKARMIVLASGDMLDSKWANLDTPDRAVRHSSMFRHNKLLPQYENLINA